MKEPENDLLFVRYLDGSATPAELEALEKILLAHPTARAWLREIAGQAVAMADFGRERALMQPEATTHARGAAARALRMPYVLAVAAVVTVLLSLGFHRAWPERKIMTLSKASGAVSWSSEKGGWTTAVEPGTRLATGTIVVEGGRGMAEVEFQDGTTIVLQGDSEASFSEGAGKSLVLRHGSLAAEVAPQPRDNPLSVRTPASEIEVVGTRFSLFHEREQTTLTVDDGRVRFSRLADRASVEVAARQSATATLDASTPLAISAATPIPEEWKQSFDEPQPPIWQGKWLPRDATGPGRLRNVLDVSHRNEDGTVVPAYVVAVRDNTGKLVTAHPDSVLRLRLRTAKPAAVTVLVGLHHPSGGFAGNFQADLQPQDLVPDESGWVHLQLSMGDLRPDMKDHPAFLSEGRVFLIYVACHFLGAELEITEASVTQPIQP